MSVVHIPLGSTGPSGPAPAAATARAMEIGQHVIAVVLTAIGVSRAVGDGVAMPLAILAGVAVLGWHTAGAILPARMRSRTVSRRVPVWWLLGLAVIWIAAVAVSAEFVWLAFLLWLLAGHLLPLRWGLVFSAAILVVVIVAPILHAGETSYADVLGPLIGGIFAFGISRGYLQLLRDAAERERLVTSLTRAQQEMAELQDELALAQRHSGAIAERTRISRDIHDTIAQALSSIRLLAHAGSRTEEAESARTFRQVETLAGDSLADVRRIVAALAPAQLEDDALASALRRMLDRAQEEVGLQVDLRVDDTLPLLSTEIEVALLRTAQSALANVRLHAGASRVVISLIDDQDSVRMDISDDGAGFDIAAWEQEAGAGSSSYGLRFMRARLRELGGGLDIESTPGEGTAVSAHLPIHTDSSRPQTPAKEETP
ncbi:signal transduction histidine kinase [Nocardioides albertanoniae]|uniref:Oxygen sensor histidine kinase NreB n=2 Tax=Nocardioides albertanoniae TaxID=1175486 RepID=A0A543A5H1_9ACTN|nr:signal transduction histidine kinase [Nocardioides albertanoniae]